MRWCNEKRLSLWERSREARVRAALRDEHIPGKAALTPTLSQREREREVYW
jgi:hypothetical protein